MIPLIIVLVIIVVIALGVKGQIGIAQRLKKPIRYYDITDMPYRVVSVPEAMLREE